MAYEKTYSVEKAIVVDDNGIDLKMNYHLLCCEGFAEKVSLFQNAASALNHLKNLSTNPANDWPGVIFLDLSMPEMDGYEFLGVYQNFSENFIHHCPVAILSSSHHKHDITETAKYKGVIKYIKKPLQAGDLNELKHELRGK